MSAPARAALMFAFMVAVVAAAGGAAALAQGSSAKPPTGLLGKYLQTPAAAASSPQVGLGKDRTPCRQSNAGFVEGEKVGEIRLR